jgi:PEGA domain-containing protein
MVERGRDAYLEGKFGDAIRDLGQAREMLGRAVEAFEEERQAAETLFRAHLYLAFTLRSKGGNAMPEAVEAMKEAIRTFPTLEPAYSEYGPENVRFYKDVRRQLEQGARGRLRVTTPGEQASVYLNGRLIGVTPLDARDVYAGRYRIHLRQGSEISRVRIVDIEGDKEMEIDVSFDKALRTDEGATLGYSDAAQRRAHLARHGSALARAAGVQNVILYWTAEGKVQLAHVDRVGNVRIAATTRAEAAQTAVALAEGRTGELFKAEFLHGKRVWTWVAGGVAIAALATGVMYGLAYESDIDDLNRQCLQAACRDPRLLSQRDRRKDRGPRCRPHVRRGGCRGGDHGNSLVLRGSAEDQ